MGLEDLEGCERFFSKSNALASSLRYASVFHQQQKIVEFMKHMDAFETYHNLSEFPIPSTLFFVRHIHGMTGEFLVNNYKQALGILKSEPALCKTMQDQGINSDATFQEWLVEERTYLRGLQKEPIRETLEMEYLQSLMNWTESRYAN